MILPPVLNKAILGGIKKLFSGIIKPNPFTKTAILSNAYFCKISLGSFLSQATLKEFSALHSCKLNTSRLQPLSQRYTFNVELISEE